MVICYLNQSVLVGSRGVTLIMSLRMRCVRTVRVLDLTLTDSSWSLAYIRGVHGSTVFGNLKYGLIFSMILI